MKGTSIRFSLAICLLLLFLSSLSKPCYSSEETAYSLQLELDVSCAIPFQTVSPVVVSFKLENIGNKTFSGILTLTGKTDEHSYSPVEFPISNLTRNDVYRNSTSFSTPDEGLYWFTVKIKSSPALSSIKLYVDSELENEGFEVRRTSSISLHSFTEFIAILAIVVSAIVAIAVAVYMKRK